MAKKKQTQPEQPVASAITGDLVCSSLFAILSSGIGEVRPAAHARARTAVIQGTPGLSFQPSGQLSRQVCQPQLLYKQQSQVGGSSGRELTAVNPRPPPPPLGAQLSSTLPSVFSGLSEHPVAPRNRSGEARAVSAYRSLTNPPLARIAHFSSPICALWSPQAAGQWHAQYPSYGSEFTKAMVVLITLLLAFSPISAYFKGAIFNPTNSLALALAGKGSVMTHVLRMVSQGSAQGHPAQHVLTIPSQAAPLREYWGPLRRRTCSHACRVCVIPAGRTGGGGAGWHVCSEAIHT